jgi:hypothetical protein
MTVTGENKHVFNRSDSDEDQEMEAEEEKDDSA